MIRLSILLSFLFYTFVLTANMASPYRDGFNPSIDLQSEDIDIERERLDIRLGDSARFAIYSVQYYIINEKQENQIDLVFDCVSQFSNFEVSLNGISIPIVETERDSVRFGSDSTFLHENFTVFTLYLEKGKHIIDVSYKGSPNLYLGNWYMEYTFLYNLSLAKQWKSFKRLDLSIDATALKDNVSVAIGDSVYQIRGQKKDWQFDQIPQDMLKIKFEPKGDFPFIIEPLYLFNLTGLLLFIINMKWTRVWRRKHLWKRYSLPAILGSLFFPIVAIVVFLFSFDLNDLLIGQYASKRHGYIFLIIFTYPFAATISFIILWCLDHNYKSKLRAKEKNKDEQTP